MLRYMRNGPMVLKDYRAESRTALFVLSVNGRTDKNVCPYFLCCKRSAATATTSGIGIRKREARAHNAGNVVDLDAVEILAAKHIDEKFDAFFIKNEIALA